MGSPARVAKIRQSRDRWKAKAIANSYENRNLRKEQQRYKAHRNRFKEKARKAENALKQIQKASQTTASKENLVFMALQLFLVARLGFRAVSRVLEVLGPYLGLKKTPCTQTVINWVERLSILKLEQAALKQKNPLGEKTPFGNGFFWILDTSIGLGCGKILTVLALNPSHHGLHETPRAPALKDLTCLGVAVASSWTGLDVANFLEKIMANLGRPAAFIKDGGTDLGKAVDILMEKGIPSFSIDDISHKIANLFKHEYGKHPLFLVFLAACGQVSKNLKQTLLACLAPPNTQTKARFMNLHRLVKWAYCLLQHSPVGGSAKLSMLSKLRSSLDDLPKCRSFILRFLRDSETLLSCQKIIKTHGLSYKTYKECEGFLEKIPKNSSIRIGFLKWAKDQLEIAAQLNLANTGMPVSSDTIESLFGVAKRHGVGEIKDAYPIARRLAVQCGGVTLQDAKNILSITVAEQRTKMACPVSLTQQRRRVLENPGQLESLALSKTQVQFELISDPKNREKKTGNPWRARATEKEHGTINAAGEEPYLTLMPLFSRIQQVVATG